MPLWTPRKALGGSTGEQLEDARVLLWHGFCSVHRRFTTAQIDQARAEHPGVRVIVHPECPMEVVDAADEAVTYVLDGRARFGVFVCGTGIGICMRANRYKGIRGAPCTSVQMALLAREHNDANVLCLGARITPDSLAVQILEAFLSEPASEVERHKRRVAKLDGNEKAV